MFTGITEAKGIASWDEGQLVVASSLRTKPGESVSVNGCCLTHVGGNELRFDLSEETLRRTTLGGLKAGSAVNLESAIKAGAPMGGHFVLGHVDAVAVLLSRMGGNAGEEFRFRTPNDGARYVVDKGSIALDGVSLTVVEPVGAEFSVWMVPHTLAETCFESMQPGSSLNVEYDVIARYLERLLQARG